MPHLVRALVAVPVAVLAAVSPTAVPATSTAATQTSVSAPVGGRQPNLVLITTDDQSVTDLRYMPRARRLLGDAGATFTDVISTFPLCCPARATLLTGQHAHNTGVLSNTFPGGGYDALRPLQDRTLPVWLEAAGYRNTFAGKYLNGYGGDATEVPPGWHNWHAAARGVYDYFGNVVNENGVLVDHTGSYQADLTQDVTEDAIRDGARSGQPFFVYQSNLAPHGACTRRPSGGCGWSPPQPAEQDRDLFGDLALPQRRDSSYDERAVADKPDFIASSRPMRARDHDRMLRYHRARARSLQAVDRNVADTVALLEEVGELDNTLIVLTSDNGFLLGEHRAFGKVLAYEPSARVPLLVRGPGVPAGVRVTGTVTLADVAPTLAEAAGATPLLEQDGRSLLPVANGAPGYRAVVLEAGSVKGVPVGEYFYQGVRTSRYTYLEYPQTGEAELYDRRLDPDQRDNAAYRPTHRETREALAGLLDRLRSCAGVACTTVGGPVPRPDPPQGPVHPDELTSIGDSTQVVTITGASWASRRGRLVAWQKRGRSWRAVASTGVRLGARGMAPPGAVRHQRGTTPAGTFRPARALGLRPDPGSRLTYRRLGAGDRWPFDPRSRSTYNVLQPRRSDRATWAAVREEVFAERPSDFRHLVVLRQNLPRWIRWDRATRQRVAADPADVRRGSFLLHTGERVRRHGWVSIPGARARWLLRWMSPATDDTRFVTGPVGWVRGNL